MPMILPLDSLTERHGEARRAADDGLGWHDLVVLFGITEDDARNLVFGAHMRRQAENIEGADEPRF